MSGDLTAPEWFKTEWDDQVLHIYQDKGGRVRNTIRQKSVDSAEKMRFLIGGKIEAEKIEGRGKRKRTGNAKSKVDITPVPWGCMPEVAEFDLDRMAPDDRDHLQRAAAMGMARASDDIAVAAMAKRTLSGIGGTGEFMNPVLADELWEVHTGNGIYRGEEMVTNLISPRMFSQLKRFKEFSSADYTGPMMPYAAQNGTGAKTWNNMHWIEFDRLPKTGNLRTGFSYTQASTGFANLKEIRSIWSWMNDEDVWLCNMKMDQGAEILIPEGLQAFTIDESINPISIDPEAYTSA